MLSTLLLCYTLCLLGMCVQVYLCAGACGGQRSEVSIKCLLQPLSTLLFEKLSEAPLELTDSAGRAEGTPESLPPPTTIIPALRLQRHASTPALLHEFWASNSGPHACIANALPNELSLMCVVFVFVCNLLFVHMWQSEGFFLNLFAVCILRQSLPEPGGHCFS